MTPGSIRPVIGSASVEPTIRQLVGLPVHLVPDGRADHDDPLDATADDERRAAPSLELSDAALQERLLVARGLVVGVLAQVTELAGELDALDDLRPLHRPRSVSSASRAARPSAVICVETSARDREPPAPADPRGAGARSGRRRPGGSGTPRRRGLEGATRDRLRRAAGASVSFARREPVRPVSRWAPDGLSRFAQGRSGSGWRRTSRTASGTDAANADRASSSYSSAASVSAHQTTRLDSSRRVLSQCPPGCGRRWPSSVAYSALTLAPSDLSLRPT